MAAFFTGVTIASMKDFEPDYYERLHVGRDDNADEIRAAFRKMAKEFHPDHFQGDEQEFVKIRRAYETLVDPELRKEYDNYLDLLAGQESLIEIRPAVRDLYDDLAGYLKEIIGLPGSAEYELVLKKEVREKNKIVRVAVPVEMICRKCLGTGGTIFGECTFCNGKGRHVHEENIDLYIPAGSREGEEMMVTFSSQEVKFILRFR